MELKDKNYLDVYIGADVEVPTPTEEDDWYFEFVGTIVIIDKEEGYVVVEDADGFHYTVEVERVEII